MRKGGVFRIVLVAICGTLIQSVDAGSAVAIANNGQRTMIVKSYGLPQKEAQQHVLDICRREGGANAKLLATSDVIGYGAIAIARRGSNWVVGVSLGRRSPTESEIRALRACLRAGGIKPKVEWGFRG
jgi:hypothetical protein